MELFLAYVVLIFSKDKSKVMEIVTGCGHEYNHFKRLT